MTFMHIDRILNTLAALCYSIERCERRSNVSWQLFAFAKPLPFQDEMSLTTQNEQKTAFCLNSWSTVGRNIISSSVPVFCNNHLSFRRAHSIRSPSSHFCRFHMTFPSCTKPMMMSADTVNNYFHLSSFVSRSFGISHHTTVGILVKFL